MPSVREHIEKAVNLLYDLPSGIDEDADPDDDWPDDTAAHTGGLVLRELQAALAELRKEQP